MFLIALRQMFAMSGSSAARFIARRAENRNDRAEKTLFGASFLHFGQIKTRMKDLFRHAGSDFCALSLVAGIARILFRIARSARGGAARMIADIV